MTAIDLLDLERERSAARISSDAVMRRMHARLTGTNRTVASRLRHEKKDSRAKAVTPTRQGSPDLLPSSPMKELGRVVLRCCETEPHRQSQESGSLDR